MPHALLNLDGTIREVVPKLLPGMKLDRAAVAYEPPVYDGELQTCVPVQPVPEGATAVSFTVAYLPDALDRAIKRAHAEIDTAAGEARARYITTVPGQEAIYLIKEAEARSYKAAGYPVSPAPGQYVMAEAKSISGSQSPTQVQIQQATDSIIAQADAFKTIGAQTEQLRRTAKIAASAGTDPLAITAAARVACGVLAGI